MQIHNIPPWHIGCTGQANPLLNTGVCKMRFWSYFALFVSVLAPFSTVKAHTGPLISLGSNPIVDTGHVELLNGTLSAITHADVNLGLDDHLALAIAEVEIDDLVAAVASELGLDDPHDALVATVSLEDLIDALIVVSTREGNGPALLALGELAADLDASAQGTIELGELFDVSDLELVDGMTVDMIDVIVNAASLWDQHHVVEPTTVMLDGDVLGLAASIASVTVDITVDSPPAIQVGPDVAMASVGQIELRAHAELADAEIEIDTDALPFIGAKLVLGQIDVCLLAPWVEAQADVLDSERGAVMVSADVSRIHMCIGKLKRGAIGEGDDEITLEREVIPSVIGEIMVRIGGHEVPVARVTARSAASVQGSADASLLEGDFPAMFPMDLGPTRAQLMDELMAHLEINVEALGSSLTTLQLGLFQDAVLDALVDEASLPELLSGDLLDGLLLPTVEILGSGVTSIGVNVSGPVSGGDDDGDDDGPDAGDDHGSGVDVDVDSDVDVDVDEDGVSVDTDGDVSVDSDKDSDDSVVDADVDADVDVSVDDDTVFGSVDPNIDLDADDDGMDADGSGNAVNTLSLAGGGCSVSTSTSGASAGWLSLVLIAFCAVLLRRRSSTRA
jgi:hypothetical protein